MYIISDAEVADQEDKGRNIYQNIFSGMSWTNNTVKFGKWDMSGNTSCHYNKVVKDCDRDYYSEVKLRNFIASTYATTFLEVKKYNSLIELANLTPTGRAFFFVAFTDDKAVLFDLLKIENIGQYETMRLCKEITLGNQTKKVWKPVYELPMNLGLKIKI
jgi:hypothetical protein